LRWSAIYTIRLAGLMHKQKNRVLGEFDAEMVANAEMLSWMMYYQRRYVFMGYWVYAIFRTQFAASMLQTFRMVYHASMAARNFKKTGEHGQARTLNFLERFYAIVSANFNQSIDYKRAANLELQWWVVHRDIGYGQRPPKKLVDSIDYWAQEVFSVPDAHRYAYLRAKAMCMRHRTANDGTITDTDWLLISDTLVAAWKELVTKEASMNREVEIKCHLGADESAVTALVERMMVADPECRLTAHNELLNHYFDCKDPALLEAVAKDYASGTKLKTLLEIIDKSGVLSVRTRSKNDQIILIVKGVPAGGDAIHGVDRMEWEQVVDVSIENLDEKLVQAGLVELAKWSGYKDVYTFMDTTIEIQFSPGYGYQVEIEKVVIGDEDAESATKRVSEVAGLVDLTEVDHNLISKMYDYYNAHWREYYGTKKVFTPELLSRISAGIAH
jgi:adenylate cyclase class IV